MMLMNNLTLNMGTLNDLIEIGVIMFAYSTITYGFKMLFKNMSDKLITKQHNVKLYYRRLAALFHSFGSCFGCRFVFAFFVLTGKICGPRICRNSWNIFKYLFVFLTLMVATSFDIVVVIVVVASVYIYQFDVLEGKHGSNSKLPSR